MPLAPIFKQVALFSPDTQARRKLAERGYSFVPKGRLPRFGTEVFDIYDPEGRPVNDAEAPASRRREYYHAIFCEQSRKNDTPHNTTSA